jgi:CubicO group peptidase (beta-lactamase class C family)
MTHRVSAWVYRSWRIRSPPGSGLSKGAWGWAGAYGTNVHIEPAEQLVSIIMMQGSVGAPQRDFEHAVAHAIVRQQPGLRGLPGQSGA